MPSQSREGLALFCCENVHAVAQLQLVGQRHDGAVHLRAHAVVAHLGVDGVGEIDRRRTGAQAHNLAFRREHEHLGGREIHFQVLQELARILRLVLPVHHLAQPRQLLVQRVAALAALLLVAPVRRHAILALPMHVLGADLDLQRTARRPDDRGVQALVHVELRHGDVIFETAGHRMPQRVHRAQSRVAVLHRLHDNAHGDEVVYLRKALALLRHLLVDGVEVLRAAHDLRLDVHLFHLVVQDGDDLVEIALALRAAFSHHAADLLELVRFQIVERQVLELPLDVVDAETVRDGRVNLQRLARLEDAAVFTQRAQRAHVVQAVGQLDDDDADVLAHGYEHLADGGGLLVGEAFHLDARDLRHALHQLCHLGIELRFHLVARHAGVLHGVVQQRCAQRFHIHAQVGQDDGHLHGMCHERLAAFAALALVRLACESEGLRQHGLVVLGQVHRGQALQLGESLLGRLRREGVLLGFGRERFLGHVRPAQQVVLHGLLVRRRLGRAAQ